MSRTGRNVQALHSIWILALGLSYAPGIHGQTEPQELQGNDPLSAWAQLRLQELEAGSASENERLQESLERIRAMYFLSVDEGDWVGRAKDSLAALEPRIPNGSEEEFAMEAYRGALEVVRAKHSNWPPNKLKYLGNGARILDELVARSPDNLEVRYLRLASYLFLPFFLRRDDSVAADLEVLVSELPNRPWTFSPPMYRAVLRFVLDNGALVEEERILLEGALAETVTRREEVMEAEKVTPFGTVLNDGSLTHG
jgi:hypothetical protein